MGVPSLAPITSVHRTTRTDMIPTQMKGQMQRDSLSGLCQLSITFSEFLGVFLTRGNDFSLSFRLVVIENAFSEIHQASLDFLYDYVLNVRLCLCF